MSKTSEVTLNYKKHLKDIPEETKLLIVWGEQSIDYDDLTNWLSGDQDRYLVFVVHFLLDIDRPDIDPKIKYLLKFSHVSQIKWGDEIGYQKFALKYLLKQYAMVGELTDEVQTLEYYIQSIRLLLFTFQDYGKQVFNNVQSNLQQKSWLDGRNLRGKFVNTPAIICGAGPSLKNDIETLKKAFDKSLIVAGGSAIECLNIFDCPFHFGGAIDPEKGYDHNILESDPNFPLLTQFRAAKSLVQAHKGPLIWSGAITGYLLEQWLYRQLKIDDYHYDAGWLVSNFLCKYVYDLGCNPIIFVGMDHCWTVNKYAADVTVNNHESMNVPIKNSKGQSAMTRMDFFLGSKWLSQFAKNHDDRIWINATSSGLSIEGVEATALDKVLQTHLTKKCLSKEAVTNALSSCDQLNLKQVPKLLNQLYTSISNTLEQCHKCLEELEKIFQNSSHPRDALNEYEACICEELAYKKILYPVWEVYKHLILPDCEHPMLAQIVFFRDVLQSYQSLNLEEKT